MICSFLVGSHETLQSLTAKLVDELFLPFEPLLLRALSLADTYTGIIAESKGVAFHGIWSCVML